MKVTINNRQTAHRIDRKGVSRFAALIAQFVETANPTRKWGSLSLALTDDDGIRRVNVKHLRRDAVTDVISFNYNPAPGIEEKHGGEVIVNVQRAAEVGKRVGNTRSRELALYIAHGCNHLTGEDDNSRAGYVRMRRRELRWLRKAALLGLTQNLILGKR